eukprot:TRINITY_DN27974_c0_g1_i1.p2 TRINITY_DN27974_c0_g1~~TRINITY_DN27974_c0_g1_i1.p2  ORF type:complete len:325 (+),score=-23.56 TRINITY_DN27974_c0_g1_i1:292-1266(+)
MSGVDLKSLLVNANVKSFETAKPKVVAVFEMLKGEVISAARRGKTNTKVYVSDAWFYDLMNQKLVEDLLEDENVDAFFEHGCFSLDWSEAKERAASKGAKEEAIRAARPRPRVWSVIKYTYAAFDAAREAMRKALGGGDFEAAWQAYQEAQAIQRTLEEDGLVPLAQELGVEVPAHSHEAERDLEAAVVHQVRSEEGEGLLAAFEAWAAGQQVHSQAQRGVVSLLSKSTGSPEEQAVAMHNRVLSAVSLGDIQRLMRFVIPLLAEHGGADRSPVVACGIVARGLQHAMTAQEWEHVLPVLEESAGASICYQLRRLGLEEPGKLQ